MKQHLLNQVAACCVLVTAAATCSLSFAAAPITRGLEVNADNGVAPGSQLRLTLEGSPGGAASARLPGINILVPLKEVAPGQYSGRYTVRPTDRIDPAAAIRVSLTADSQTVLANYTFPPSFKAPLASGPVARDVPFAAPVPVGPAVPAPMVVQAPPPPAVPPPPLPPLRIDRFAVAPVGRAEPGAEILFRLDGAPGASASFDIPGIVFNVPMRELRAGIYEGSYTIRPRDDLAAAGLVTATLRADNRVTTTTLSQPLVGNNRPPQIGNLMPREGTVVARGPTQVSGNFDVASGGGVDPRTVRITISGRDVTALSQITPREFTFQGMLPPGRHTAEVVVADRAGNVAQKTWSFDVGGAVLGASSAVLPLMVTSHANNALVHDTTTIRGRTAPGAVLRVRVDFILPAGGILPLGVRMNAEVAEPLLSETVQADANGDFSFTFNPRYTRDNATLMPVPGTRYDVSITAQRDNQVAESRLMLFQRS